jgi:hypothetical protein
MQIGEHLFNEDSYDNFNIIKIETNRVRNDVSRVDTWRGIRLTEIIKKYNLTDSDAIEFLAPDRYRIVLKKSEIEEYDPIIAIQRNDTIFTKDQYRLISQNMPEMYWIANIAVIRPIKTIMIPDPRRIVPYHTLQNFIRLYTDPEPFVNVKGYSIFDMVNLFSNNLNVFVRTVSIDGMEQNLSFMENYSGAFLVIDGDGFKIQAPMIPTGMWQKDIMLIDINGYIIFFYNSVDTDTNVAYKDFINLLSGKERKMTTDEGTFVITNWNKIVWENVRYIE